MGDGGRHGGGSRNAERRQNAKAERSQVTAVRRLQAVKTGRFFFFAGSTAAVVVCEPVKKTSSFFFPSHLPRRPSLVASVGSILHFV